MIPGNADRPAFPADTDRLPSGAYGLTKREYFAGLAMQGIFASGRIKSEGQPTVELVGHAVAVFAIAAAAALLTELDKPK